MGTRLFDIDLLLLFDSILMIFLMILPVIITIGIITVIIIRNRKKKNYKNSLYQKDV